MIAQRSPEWFEQRLGKATASRFKDIMSRTPAPRDNYKTQLALERVKGVQAASYTNDAMQHGIDFEDSAKFAFMELTGLVVRDAEFVEHGLLAAGASPDGYVDEDDAIIEIKCPTSATHLKTMRDKKLPSQYVAQVQGQMWITGKNKCYFVSYDPEMPINAQLIVIGVKRDDEYIAKLEQSITEFLNDVELEEAFIREYSI